MRNNSLDTLGTDAVRNLYKYLPVKLNPIIRPTIPIFSTNINQETSTTPNSKEPICDVPVLKDRLLPKNKLVVVDNKLKPLAANPSVKYEKGLSYLFIPNWFKSKKKSKKITAGIKNKSFTMKLKFMLPRSLRFAAKIAIDTAPKEDIETVKIIAQVMIKELKNSSKARDQKTILLLRRKNSLNREYKSKKD